ncbi:MAG TPA: histidine kinase [Acidimicrobiales bacterium]|nr:histidine kinase [Acidimicrobiales bacterium]
MRAGNGAIDISDLSEGSVLPATRVDDRPIVLGALVTLGTVGLVAVSLFTAAHVGHRTLWIVSGAVILCWAVAGLATLPRARHLGWLVSLGALLASGAMTANRFADANGLGSHGTARNMATIVALVAVAVSMHVLLSLPDGDLTSRSRQITAALWYTAALVVGAFLAGTGRVLTLWPVAVVWTLAIFSSLPSVHARYVGASAAGRQRVQGLAVGVALATIAAIVVGTLHLLVAWPVQVAVTLIGAFAIVPLGLVAGTRPFASRLDRFLVHLLVVLGMVVVMAAAYLVALRGFGRAPTVSSERAVLWWSMVAAAVAVVAYLSLRRRFERVANSLTYGAREAPDEVVRTFGTRLTRAIPMDELLLQLVESLRKTLTLASAEIYTGTGDVLELAVSAPDVAKRSFVVTGDERTVIARAGVSGNAWVSVWIPSVSADRPNAPLRVAPISHGGELLGIIVVTRVDGAVAFREEDDRVLTELARQVALALHNAQLDTALQSSLDELQRQADELRASRARVVASGDAERRRVERNLHDGAQQHLVALAVNLRLTKDVVVEDPEAAVKMLDELGVAVQDTIKELRELAHGIYPPLLVDSGLGEALRAVSNRSPLDIELATDGLGRYGSDVEAAIYFCCLEALQNAGKHAPESRVKLRIWEESGGLLFEVSDDGPGFDIRLARKGHGYVNMSDRLGAIGGLVRWESQLGHGTTIRGSVPLN